MGIKKKILIMAFISLLTPLFAESDTESLHNFYEQNGDCYVLVGSGSKRIDGHTVRGVYGLNNLSSTGSTEWIYNPDDAYGITAGQNWTGSAIQKRLYTFSGNDTPNQNISGKVVQRRMIATYSFAVYDGEPPFIVHRWHTQPNSSRTGRGNHSDPYLDGSVWWAPFSRNGHVGACYPCSIVPVANGTDAAGNQLYNYIAGSGWYHDPTDSVYSPFTYGSFGGTVHYCAYENLTGTIRNLRLKKYNLESRSFILPDDPIVSNLITKVNGTKDKVGECVDGCITAVSGITMPGVESPILKTAYSSTVGRTYLYNRDFGTASFTVMGLNTSSGDEVKGDGSKLDCEHLGISSKSSTANYVYLIGKDLINQWLRESSYTGSLIANKDDLACCAVSDQWWQTGGIVYAYDKRQNKIFCFNRVEKTVDLDGDGVNDSSSLQEVIDLGTVFSGGIKPDRIACDGFGNLYVLRTERIPAEANTSTFVDGNEDDRIRVTASGGYSSMVAVYKQKIAKKVYMKEYGADKSFVQIRNDIKLGENVYYRQYRTADGGLDTKPKIWDGNLFLVTSDEETVSTRTELAVINCPTPPRPDHLIARTDCVGPAVLPDGEYWQMAVSERPDGRFDSSRDLYFIVENAPTHEGHGLNVGNFDFDLDGDGKVGRYPNTIIKSETKYFWKIIQTHDRNGNELDEEVQVLPSEKGTSLEGSSVILFPKLLEGKFKVGVKVTYSYYDYSKLPVGSFMSDRDTVSGVHVTGKTARGDENDVNLDKGWSWATIDQVVNPIPDEESKGIIMTGTDGISGNTFKPGRPIDGGACPSGCGHIQCDHLATFTSPVGRGYVALEDTKFIMDGYSLCGYVDDSDFDNPTIKFNDDSIDWAMQLRDTSFNISSGKNRTTELKGLPPTPSDPSMIPGTLKWMNENPSNNKNRFVVTWKSELKDGSNVIWSNTQTTEFDGTDATADKCFTLDKEKLRALMPIPSEPLRYTITAKVDSSYSYNFWQRTPIPHKTILPDGTASFTYTYTELPMPKYITITLSGNCEVCVTDNTGPGLFQYNPENGKVVKGYLVAKNQSDKFFLKATTGGTISDTGNIDIYVADNNPFANYNGTKTVNKGDKDPYHYNSEHDKLKRLISNFDLDNRKQTAIFHYDTQYKDSSAIVDVPDSSLKSSYTIDNPSAYSYDNSITESELEILGLSTSKTLSYTKYSFNISNIKHVSRKTVSGRNYYSPKFDYNYANNMSTYDNRHFGLEWRETCYSESNNNKLTNNIDGNNIDKYKTHGGIIVITDNDRPNGFITAYHDRIGRQKTIPTGVASGSWIASYLNDNSGPENWYKTPTWSDKNSISSTCFNNHENQYDIDYSGLLFRGSAPEASTMLFMNDETLYVDVPVKFTASMVDNINGLVELDNEGEDCFRIVCVEGDTSQIFNRYLLDDGKPYIRQVFRKPGKYYVELKIKDKPKGFPETYEDAKKKVFPDATPNKRVIRAYFEVKDSKMEYRVLERGINDN